MEIEKSRQKSERANHDIQQLSLSLKNDVKTSKDLRAFILEHWESDIVARKKKKERKKMTKSSQFKEWEMGQRESYQIWSDIWSGLSHIFVEPSGGKGDAGQELWQTANTDLRVLIQSHSTKGFTL